MVKGYKEENVLIYILNKKKNTPCVVTNFEKNKKNKKTVWLRVSKNNTVTNKF